MAEYRAWFPSAYASVAQARRAIVAFARPWFSGDALRDVESAVGEALANCAEHGHRDGAEIFVHCRFDGRRLIVSIKDHGSGFARWNDAEFGPPQPNALRGYGVRLMRQLMDSIDYSERGRAIRLIKNLAPEVVLESSAARENEG